MKFSEMISNQSTTGLLREYACSAARGSDPDSVISAVVERVGGHGRWESQEFGTPGLSGNFSLGYWGLLPSVAEPPLPLQAFFPLQEWVPFASAIV